MAKTTVFSSLNKAFDNYSNQTAIITYDGKKLTFSEVKDKASKLSSVLETKKIRNTDLVAIVMERNSDYLIAIATCILFGYGFIPIDNEYPKQRIDKILSDSKAVFVIDNEVFNQSQKVRIPVKSKRPEPQLSDPAYVVYTSGSTGNPKGILHDQESLAQALVRNRAVFKLNENDIWGASAPFSFVAIVLEILSTWYSGAAVQVIPRNIVKDPDILAAYINTNNITATFIPPRVLKYFKKIGTSLRTVVVGGEKIANLGPKGFRLITGYGQSETCGPCIFFDIKKEYEQTPIGYAAQGNALYLLDQNNNLVQEGEICVAGHFMTCYINLPKATSDTVVDNPFKATDGCDKMIRTGDIGKRLENGDVVYVNRKDWMIKINGQRVEPSEIENVLLAEDDIKEAVVKSFVNRYDQTYICAYFTSDKKIDCDWLRNILLPKLPSYMMPSFFVQLDELPLNNNRKLDRGALKEPDSSDFLTGYEEPQNETQSLICTAFAKILGLPKVGILDDFFRLGGDSIKAVMVVNECSSLNISVKHVFIGKTPKEISKLIEEYDDANKQQISEKETMPLTDSQMAVYLDSCNEEPDCRYNIPFEFSFPKEKTDADKLRNALYLTWKNHQAFSLAITTVQGVPVMQKNKTELADVDIINASDEEYQKIKSEFVKPFIVGKERLYRALIVETDCFVNLLFDVHHLIFDGTSLNIFQKELCDAYIKGKLESETITPFMVSAYEQSDKHAQQKKLCLDYYKDELACCETDSNLNPDLFMPKFSTKKANYEASVGLDTKTVEFFTQNCAITENTLFASAFALVLAKFTCQTNSLFMSGENGRHRAGMENTVGMFVRTFPVFVQIEEESKTSDYLSYFQQKYFEAMTHDEVPYADIANTCQIDSGVKFVYQSEILNGVDFNGAKIKTANIFVDSAMSNLDVMVMKQNGGYKVSVGFRKSMYSLALIESFVDTYNTIVDGLVKTSFLKEISFVNEKQETQLNEFNNTELEYNSSESTVDMFKKVVEKYSDCDAVIFKDQTITYKKFDELTDNLAAYIVDQKIEQNSFVAVLTGRNIYMPVVSFGIIKAGCAYQPLDPAYPSDRLSFMVNDSKAQLIIADRKLYSQITGYRGKVLFTDQIESLPDKKPKVKVGPDNRIVLLYTSGTTGIPKGVVITHKNVVNLVLNHTLNTGFGHESRYASYASFGFDAYVMDMFTSLCNGGSFYIVPEEIRLDLNGLVRFYDQNKITHGFVTTQLGCMLAQAIKNKDFKVLMLGGEKIIPFKPSEQFTVLNGYGPSECVAYATQYKVKDDSPIQPIGKANKNTKLYIVDKYLRRLPAGACGELCIAGAQVSEGYLNRPEQTNAVFMQNPFTEKELYQRVYKTGDIARILPDGNLEFVGRRDSQVKIRGFRIELKEVEQVIRSYKDIKDATVQAYDDPNGGKFIASFIVSDKKINIDLLNDYIASQKPAYMVPAVTMQLDAIPLNQNGKVDRKKLPKPEVKIEEIVKAQNETQKKILDIVCDVLGTNQIGITTDIFRAGITSLGTIRLNALLSDTFDVVFQTSDIKDNYTVIKLEQFINASKDVKPEAEVKSPVYPDYPLTKTQEGIFIECQTDENSTVYNIPYLLKISNEIDLEKLKISVCEAVQVHSYINTTLFYDENGNIRQKLAPIGSFDVDDIQTIEFEDLEQAKNNIVKPHKMLGSRLFRIQIVKTLQDNETYLFFDFHHIICDGTSMAIFVNDIESSYEGISLKDEKFTGYDISLNEQKLRNSHVYSEAQQYYENLLSGADTGFLPKSDMHSYAKNGTGKLVVNGKTDTVKKIAAYCKKNNVSENSVLCTAFGYVLSLYNGSDSSLFTTVYNGRMDSRLARTVSMLVKTLPVLFNPEKEDTLSNIKAMSEQLINSMTNDIYSFAEISRKFSVKADVMFIYQGKGFENEKFCNKECCSVELEIHGKKAPLCVQLQEKNNCYQYTVEWNPQMYTNEFARCLFSALEAALGQITEVSSLKEIDLTDDQTVKLLDEINKRECEFDRSKSVADRLKKNAEKRPSHPAVVYQDKIINYGKFNNLTDNLASYLIENGAKKNQFVAVLLSRSEQVPVACWAIVKAGSAYLPIDTTYPKDRIDLMLRDSSANIIVTEHKHQDKINDFKGKVIFTDEFESLPNKTPNVRINEEDPFILIYSSGSTGTPKGSMLPHRSLNALLLNNKDFFDYQPEDRVASYASFGFDAGLMDLFSTLSFGVTLYIIPQEIRLDIPSMEKFFIENKITHSFMTTQVARTFILNTKCTTLRHFFFGGEKMIPFKPPKNIYVCNGYGPSETNCYVTTFKLADDRQVQPVGKQTLNTKLYVLDKTGKRLPPYACGELCIAGLQVALGYLNRPEKNAQSFVKNPYSDDKDYAIMYKTGDIVRMYADGNYDFVGRRDGQVKIRGFRIELEEIEHIISDYPNVKQVTAQAFDDPNGGKFIAAYYVAQKPVDPEEISEFIKQSKPSYMVPAFMTQIDSIPLTSNGKVNKANLPKPKPVSKKEGARPSTETENKLCQIFAETLNAEKVYADDDFFELGGTSISALQLIVKCVNAGYMVVYKNLFENPTPQMLAKLVSGEKKSKDVFAPSGEEAKKYDYSALKYNVPENLDKIKYTKIKDVLLTGVTGFLGAHVLKELLEEDPNRKVICLARSKDGISAEERLKLTCGYYFEDDYEQYIGNRIFIVDGQLDDKLIEKLGNYHFDTIINCAANVHHFGSEESLMRDNYDSISILINIAKTRNAKLIQTSSISVAGESVDGHIAFDTKFKENNLNIGQSLQNMYVRTKYLAEQEVINAVSRGEIKGKIIRFGNLMARESDAEFQINSSNSGCLNLINGIRIIGCYPIESLDTRLEFSPIDYAAKALVLLSGTPDEFTVFHADNSHAVHIANVLQAMNEIGFKINYVESSEFTRKFSDISHDEKYAKKLSGLLSYLNNAGGTINGVVKKHSKSDSKVETRIKIGEDNSFTVKALYRLNFFWPLTDDKYLCNLIRNLKDLNFFND